MRHLSKRGAWSPSLAGDDVITDGSTVALRGNELSIVSFLGRLLAF